jgi:acetyl esterase/lipase
MKRHKFWILLFTILFAVISCRSGLSGVSQPTKTGSETPSETGKDPFEAHLATSPIPVKDGVKFYGNVAYGSKVRTKLDLWIPADAEEAPLVIFFHGGGFNKGDKSFAYEKERTVSIGPGQIDLFLSRNIAFATVNYSLLMNKDKEGVMKCLNDSKRALQFLRHHGSALGIDTDKIGLAGISAGGGTALWLAYNDDLKDADHADPVMRESTRVSAVAVLETQSTYDVLKWSEEVFPDGFFSIEKVKNTGLGRRLAVFYGINSLDELTQPEIAEYRSKIDMLSMVSPDDPATYIFNKQDFEPEKGKVVGNLLHSPYHAVALRKRLEAAGVQHEVYLPAEGTRPKSNRYIADFLVEVLTN